MEQTHKIDWASVKANLAAQKKARATAGNYGPLFRAAALRSVFTPEELMLAVQSLPEPPSQEALELELNQLLAVSTVVPNADGTKQWRIQDELRQKVIADLSTLRIAQQYLPEDAAKSTDLLQRMLALYVAGEAPSLEAQSLAELNASISVVRWLSAYTSETIPQAPQVQAELKRKELLAPLQTITEHFQGRSAELAQLNSFLHQAPASEKNDTRYGQAAMHPFSTMVFGIGGAGKTTLVARFILDQLKGQYGPIPTSDGSKHPILGFAYLDFDRPDARLEPLLLLDEIARQLQLQFSTEVDLLQRLRQNWQSARNTSGNSTRGFERDFYLDQFGEWWKTRGSMLPLLLVFDSFEEVQNWVSDADRDTLLRFLIDLKRAIPSLKVLISGRANVDYFDMQQLEVGDFDEVSAKSYLKAKGVTQQACADVIWKHVGGNPLDLKLAAAEAQQTGCDNLPALLRGIDKRRIREILFHRQLEHIQDPVVKKLAVPGLVVRTVNAEIIREVLAGPCGLGEISLEEAQKLMDKLQKEAFLVKYEQGNWRFRPDLRSQLIDLSALLDPRLTKMVHDKAVEYYASKNDPASRAEWVYHRLKRGDVPESIGELDFSAIQPYLRYALNELPNAAFVFLASGFGLELPGNILKDIVELPRWENSMAQTIHNSFITAEEDYLRRLASDLEQRPERSVNSPLQLEETRLYLRLSALEKAAELAQTAIHDAKKAMDSEKEIQAKIYLIGLQERQFKHEQNVALARETLSEAILTHFALPACRVALLGMRAQARLGLLTEEIADAALEQLQELDFSKATTREANTWLRDLLPENFFSRQIQKGPSKKAASIPQKPEEDTPFPFRRFSAAVLERLVNTWQTDADFRQNLDILRKDTPDMEALETGSLTRLNRPLRDIGEPGDWEACSYDVVVFAEKEGQMDVLLHKDDSGAEPPESAPSPPPMIDPVSNVITPGIPSPKEPVAVSTLLKQMSSANSGSGIADQVRELVASGRTEDAISTLRDFTANNPSARNIDTDIILLSARHTSLTRDFNLGLLNFEDFQRSQNQITYALLELIKGLSNKIEADVATSEVSELYLSDEHALEKIIGGKNLKTIAWLTQALKTSQAVGLCVAPSRPDQVVFWIQDDALTNGIKAMTVPYSATGSESYEFNYRAFKSGWISDKVFKPVGPWVTDEKLEFLITGFSGDVLPEQVLTWDKKNTLKTGQAAVVLTLIDKQSRLSTVKISRVGAAGTFTVDSDEPVVLLPGSPVLNDAWEVIGMIISGKEAISTLAVINSLNQTRPEQSAESEPPEAGEEQPSNPASSLQAKQFLVLYDEADEAHAQNLRMHLTPMIRSGKATFHFLHSDAIAGEDPWRRAEDLLSRTDYVICLVTARFIAGKTLDFALKSGGRLLPILVSPADIKDTGLEQIKSLPSRGRTISSFSDQAEGYTDIVGELRKLL